MQRPPVKKKEKKRKEKENREKRIERAAKFWSKTNNAPVAISLGSTVGSC
jgi:hypothetical protein